MTQPMNKNSIRTIQNCIATRTDFHETTPECERQKISLDMMGRMLREFPVESYEQGAPSNVLNYKCYSYEKAMNPFQLLRNHYNGNDGLLSQYYAQLVQQGMLKGASQQDIEKCFHMYGGEELNQALDQADSIAQYLSMIEKQQDDQHIHVCPIMCGAGKSQAISKLIVDHAMNDTGMIVVTDNKQRMMDYINGVNNPTVKSMKDLCVRMGKITILNEDTRAEVASEQAKSPVLIITTQHYFKIGLGGVQHYLSWNGGRREVIIIDEAPYINRTVQIDRGSFNNVLTMLENGAGGDQVTATEKQWCIDVDDR